MSEPVYYDKPYVGQPFRRRQNADVYEDGQVTGVRVHGTFNRDGKTVEDWTACISLGFGNNHYMTHRDVPDASTSWMSIPEEECQKRYGPGYIALKRDIDDICARLGEPAATPSPFPAVVQEAAQAAVAARKARV